MSLLVPVLWVGFFLQSTVPLHRAFVEILEIKPALDLKSFPFILLLMWSVLQCSDAIITILILALLYLKFNYFWVSALQPIFKINNAMISTQIGRVSKSKFVQIFRMIQVTNKMFNPIIANFLMVSHFLC